jgi:thiopurine S-methyltransferase
MDPTLSRPRRADCGYNRMTFREDGRGPWSTSPGPVTSFQGRPTMVPSAPDMRHEFWDERWRQGQIGFHLGRPHDWLVDAADRFPPQARVYVPLCGKTVDLVWLRDRGHEVFGCEFVAGAVRDFLREQGLTAATERRQAGGGAPFECHRTRGLSVLQGDALELDPGLIGGPVDVVFDRAALVALDPACRNRYVDGLHRLLRPGGHVLLIAFAYDQTRVEGPPWSVDATTIERLFGDRFFIETLAVRAEEGNPRFQAAGVAEMEERCCWLTRRD